MPIAARASDPVLMVALTACKDHMPQLARATPLNRAEHFALLKCDLTQRINRRRVGQMQINHRRLQTAVAEVLLNQTQWNTGFRERDAICSVRRKRRDLSASDPHGGG